ncbi:hypothetical protein GCM10027048_40180 [Hymenobacter coalescens]
MALHPRLKTIPPEARRADVVSGGIVFKRGHPGEQRRLVYAVRNSCAWPGWGGLAAVEPGEGLGDKAVVEAVAGGNVAQDLLLPRPQGRIGT